MLYIGMWIAVCWIDERCFNSEDFNGVLKYGSNRSTVFSVQIPVGFCSIYCIEHMLYTGMWIAVPWEE